MADDPEAYYPTITPKEMLLCRLVAGLFGAAFFGMVVYKLVTGDFHYALVEWSDGGRNIVRAANGSVEVETVTQKIFALLSFGLMGLGAVAFAIRPKFYANPKVIVAVVGIILLAFVGLRLSE